MKKNISICLLALPLVGCDSPVVTEVSAENKNYTITQIFQPIHRFLKNDQI